jgi:hypothetical protein
MRCKRLFPQGHQARLGAVCLLFIGFRGSLHVDGPWIPCGTCGQGVENMLFVFHPLPTLIHRPPTIALKVSTTPKTALRAQ